MEPQPDLCSIDSETLQNLAEEVSVELMPTLIDAFLKELDTRTAIIRSTVLIDNEKSIRLQVHSIKSCARTFGALALAEKAALIEQLIDGQSHEAQNEIEQLFILLPATRQAFSQYKSNLSCQ